MSCNLFTWLYDSYKIHTTLKSVNEAIRILNLQLENVRMQLKALHTHMDRNIDIIDATIVRCNTRDDILNLSGHVTHLLKNLNRNEHKCSLLLQKMDKIEETIEVCEAVRHQCNTGVISDRAIERITNARQCVLGYMDNSINVSDEVTSILSDVNDSTLTESDIYHVHSNEIGQSTFVRQSEDSRDTLLKYIGLDSDNMLHDSRRSELTKRSNNTLKDILPSVPKNEIRTQPSATEY